MEELKLREEEENRRKYEIAPNVELIALHSTLSKNRVFFPTIHRRVEMEQNRKLEEMERRRQEDEDLRAAVALQVC